MHSKLLTASLFLQTHGRGIIPILGDGNCLFRALSKLAYGEEDHHVLIRRVTAEFISSNSSVFQQYCTENITEHVNRVKRLTVWGSHVELQAAACLLDLPIYVCTQKDGNKSFFWEVFKPLQEELIFPESRLIKPAGVWHFELCHTSNCHYDIITEGDDVPRNPPLLQRSVVHMDID
jgi:hypothetical protein